MGVSIPSAWAQSQETPSEAGATWSLDALKALEAESSELSLERAWRLLTEHAPEYQAALSERAAAQTERAQGRAGLLPSVQAGFYRGKISGVQRALNRPPEIAESQLDYDSQNTYVQLTQPILDYSGYAGYRRGIARAAVGEAQFQLTEAELALALIEAYIDVAHAQGALTLRHSLVESLEKQATGLLALFEQNEATRIDAQEVEGRLALARADLVAAEQDLIVAKRELESLTGVAVERVWMPREPFPALPSGFSSLERWLEQALMAGPALRLSQQEEKVADAEVARAVSSHTPNLDFVASWIQADSENLSTLSQKYDHFTFGLRLSIPIFSGGYDSASHAQARALLQQSTHQTDANREVVLARTTREYLNVTGGMDHVRAVETAAESASLSLEAVRRSYELGAASNIELLRIQDRNYEIQHDLLAARLNLVRSYGSLHAVAGEPIWETFSRLSTYFFEP